MSVATRTLGRLPDGGGEIKRRLVHATGTLIPIPYLLGEPPLEWGIPGFGRIPWEAVQVFVVGAMVVAMVLEALRLSGRLEWRIYDVLTREYEQDNLAGYALYFVGMAVVVLAFDPQIAIPAIFMLTIGDPISGLLGSATAHDTKRPGVLAAMFGVCLLLALPFVNLVAAAAGALAATVADGIKPVVAGHVVDDNLTIPVGAALAIWAVLTFVPVPL